MAGLGRRTHYRKHLTDAVLFDLVEPDKSKGERIAMIVATRGGNQFEIVLPSDTKEDSANTIGNKKLALLPTKFRKLVWIKRGDFVIVSCASTITTPLCNEYHSQDQHKEENTSIPVDDGSRKTYKEVDVIENMSGSISKQNSTTELSSGSHEESLNAVGSHNEDNNDDISGGIRYMISHILYEDQIRNLKKKGFWPLHDPTFSKSDKNIINSRDISNENPLNLHVDEGKHNTGQDEYDVKEELYDDGIVYGDETTLDDDDEYFINTNRMSRLNIDDSSSDEDSE
mmetsp:Transcript_7727/g.11048  ORF Transcript_7727/g.11048 Transcript_7727/m.11048 type:complete len:285 (-) Transcript_7727:349-1203(-)